ncbi:MAG: PKD domain-containing protein [Cyanobacteriota bacterium]|nr:PKD domain-containing protein [Cyanobacteriota bacterium]
MNEFYKTLFILPLSGMAIALTTAPSLAAILSTGGNVTRSGLPSDLRKRGEKDNKNIYLFQEKQNVLLRNNLGVDILNTGTHYKRSRGTISAGTTVNSYLLHFNPSKKNQKTSGYVTFDEDILGLMVSKSGLNNTDNKFGLSGSYSTQLKRGIINEKGNDSVTLSSNRRKLDVDLLAGTAVDQIRIFTERSVAPNLYDFDLSNNTINEGSSATAYLKASDPNKDAISFFLNGRNIGTDYDKSGTRSQSEYLGIFRDEGTHTYRARARDEDGKYSNTRTRTLTVRNVDPTIINITQDLQIYPEMVFDFAADASDPGRLDVLTYNWDLDNDGIYDDFTGKNGKYSFSEPGNHTVKLQVADGDGGFAYDSFNVAVEPTKPFSFRFTDIKAVEGDPEGDKFQFAFEVVNWTDSPVSGIGIALNGKTELIKINETPSFDGATVDLNGRPIGSDRDPISGTPNRLNLGTVSSASKSAIEWKTKTPISTPNLTNLDDRSNVLDGFIFAVDDIDEKEILGLNWFLLDENGDPLGTAAGGNKYGFGMLDLLRLPFDDPGANFREGKLKGKPSELFYNNVNLVEESVPDTISASSAFSLVPNLTSSALRAANFSDLLEATEEEAIALFKGSSRQGLTGRFLNPEDNKFNAPINASVPEPSTLLGIFGFAAASLFGLKRRR